MKGKAPVWIHCSLYYHEYSDVYSVRQDVILTGWKTNQSIICKVDLQPIQRKCTLHPLSKDHLGVVPYNCSEESLSPLIQDGCLGDSIDHNPEIDEDFFEVKKVLDRRLSKDTLCDEFKVQFKGYGSHEDMWLPSSFFNHKI